MRDVQLMNKNKNIFRVYHIRIMAKKKFGSHEMKQTDSSIIIVRNVFVLTSASTGIRSYIFTSLGKY